MGEVEWGSFRGRGLGEYLAGRWRGLAAKVMLNSSNSSSNNKDNNSNNNNKDRDNKEEESLHNRLRE